MCKGGVGQMASKDLPGSDQLCITLSFLEE